MTTPRANPTKETTMNECERCKWATPNDLTEGAVLCDLCLVILGYPPVVQSAFEKERISR